MQRSGTTRRGRGPGDRGTRDRGANSRAVSYRAAATIRGRSTVPRPARDRRGRAAPSEQFAERGQLEVRRRLGRDPAVGVQIDRPVIASEDTERLAVQHAGLGEDLDGRRPGGPLVAVAILDLQGDARVPATISGLASIASRTSVRAGARDDRGSLPAADDGSASRA
jgi:hypothetical protein